MNEVAEGIRTTLAVKQLADRAGLEMPITNEVKAVLYDGKSAGAGLGDRKIHERRRRLLQVRDFHVGHYADDLQVFLAQPEAMRRDGLLEGGRKRHGVTRRRDCPPRRVKPPCPACHS